VFINTVDDQPVPQFDVNDVYPATYRQFQVPPGQHTLTVFYREPSNLEVVSAGPRQIIVNVEPGATYHLTPNRIGWDTSLGSTVRTANWRPEVLRDGTNESAGISLVGR
jgi:hypothetical protein